MHFSPPLCKQTRLSHLCVYIYICLEFFSFLFCRRQSPRPQGQVLQLQNPGPDVHHKGDDTNDDTEDVDNIVAVAFHVTCATAIETPLLVGLHSAREWLGDERTLQLSLELGITRMAGCAGETVHETEDEEARECAAQVRNTTGNSQSVSQSLSAFATAGSEGRRLT